MRHDSRINLLEIQINIDSVNMGMTLWKTQRKKKKLNKTNQIKKGKKIKIKRKSICL